jgi:hypothetical protein
MGGVVLAYIWRRIGLWSPLRPGAAIDDRAYKCSLAEYGGLRQVSRLFRREVQMVRVRQQFAPPNWESINDP